MDVLGWCFFITGFLQLDIKVIVEELKIAYLLIILSWVLQGIDSFSFSFSIWRRAKTSNYCVLNFLQLSEMFDKKTCNFQLLQLLPSCLNGKILQWQKLPIWKHASKIRKISQNFLSPKLNSPKFHGFLRISIGGAI